MSGTHNHFNHQSSHARPDHLMSRGALWGSKYRKSRERTPSYAKALKRIANRKRRQRDKRIVL